MHERDRIQQGMGVGWQGLDVHSEFLFDLHRVAEDYLNSKKVRTFYLLLFI